MKKRKAVKASKRASKPMTECICGEYIQPDGKKARIASHVNPCRVHCREVALRLDAEREAQRNRDAMLGEAVRRLIDLLMPLIRPQAGATVTVGNGEWFRQNATSGYIAPARPAKESKL